MVRSGAQDAPPGLVPGIITSTEAVRPIVDVVFDHLHARMLVVSGQAKPAGPPEPLSERDRQALAAIYGLVVDKYVPAAVLQKFGLELAALVLTVTIVIPKVFEYRAYFKSKEKEKKKVVENGVVDPSQASQPLVRAVQGGASEPWKEAYERAVAEGRIPA